MKGHGFTNLTTVRALEFWLSTYVKNLFNYKEFELLT